MREKRLKTVQNIDLYTKSTANLIDIWNESNQLFWQTFLSIWGIYHHLPSIFCSRLPDECTIWKSKVWFSTDFISDDLKRQRISWRSKVSRTEERFCICPVNVPLGNCRQSICSVTLPGRLLSNLTKIVISTLSAAVFVILWMVAVPE